MRRGGEEERRRGEEEWRERGGEEERRRGGEEKRRKGGKEKLTWNTVRARAYPISSWLIPVKLIPYHINLDYQNLD